MTGPLAPLFAQVREGIGAVDADSGLMHGLIGREVRRVHDALAALSSIERHVQEQDELLERLLDETEPDGHKRTEPWPKPGHCVWCDARAALSAREKGEE